MEKTYHRLSMHITGQKVSVLNKKSLLSNPGKNARNNTIIYTLDAHGEVPSEYFMVPNNTIICMLSPLGTYNVVDGYEKSKDILLFQSLSKIKYPEFKELLQTRSLYRNAQFDVSNQLYNCFSNSIWYYPGQICPEINISLEPEEFEMHKKNSS